MNEYLKTIFQDFARKVDSINRYIDIIKGETGSLNQSTLEWVGKLKKKYEILKKFQDSRQKSAPTTEFSVELPPNAKSPSNDEDVKAIEAAINDSNEQLNYGFGKTLSHVQFLVQSFQDLEELVNQIYDYYDDMFGAM